MLSGVTAQRVSQQMLPWQNWNHCFHLFSKHLWHSCNGFDIKDSELKCLTFVFSLSFHDLIFRWLYYRPVLRSCLSPFCNTKVAVVWHLAPASSFAYGSVSNLTWSNFLLSLDTASESLQSRRQPAHHATSAASCLRSALWGVRTADRPFSLALWLFLSSSKAAIVIFISHSLFSLLMLSSLIFQNCYLMH